MNTNQFNPDWDQIKPFNDRIAELEKVAKQALEALEIGRDYTFETAEQFHIEMRGYKQQRHDAMDSDVRQIDASITALRQALEQPAQQKTDHDIPDLIAGALGVSRGTAYDLMREAIAEQQEPVAWMYVNDDDECEQIEYGEPFDDPAVTPLYTHPSVIDKSAATRIATVLGWEPKKEWVGLTDDEANELWESTDSDWELMKRTEAKLKEKNT